MISTVVGSYPVVVKEDNLLKNKIPSIFGSYDPCKVAIRHAVESQLKAGIDIISDGQVRGEMVEIFTKHIPGFKMEGNSCNISSKIVRTHKSMGAKDLKLAIKYMDKFLKKSDFTKEEKAKKGVKGIVTGPCTIVQSSKLSTIYKDKKTAIIDMAYVLMDECIFLEKVGAKLIQIDEPFLSTGLIDMDIAKKAINLIADEINIPVSIHSCGDIAAVFKDISTFNVDIIDCEFAGHPSNLDILAKYSNDLKAKDKKIGLGVVDTKKIAVESVEEIAKVIEKGSNIVGEKNLFIDPDCGMKLLPDEIAFNKLKNMIEAMKLFN